LSRADNYSYKVLTVIVCNVRHIVDVEIRSMNLSSDRRVLFIAPRHMTRWSIEQEMVPG